MANIGELSRRRYGSEEGTFATLVNENDTYSVYFKGSVREEMLKDWEIRVVVGIGVVILDSTKNMIFELSKAVESGTDTCRMEAKLEALIEGLNAAKQLGIRKLKFFCKGLKLYNYLVDENAIETEEKLKVEPTMRKVKFLQRQFDECSPSLLWIGDAMYGRHATNLASKAKFSQVSCPGVTIPPKNLKETCKICLEDTEVLKMLSVHNCLHRCCSSCVKRHVEVKLRQGTLPKCPHEGCASDIKIDRCRNILDPELVKVMNQRLKEYKIPVEERVYCPNPRCSNLMSKTEVLNYSKSRTKYAEQNGYGECLKCRGRFCVNCKVPWHSEMTCSDYKILHPYSCAEDEIFNSLAKSNSWRRCIKCSLMIELAVGCYHIICRCGYQFCYTCGSEWKNNKASCSCPLWDEHRIIY